jgi:hypothetical protein
MYDQDLKFFVKNEIEVRYQSLKIKNLITKYKQHSNFILNLGLGMVAKW